MGSVMRFLAGAAGSLFILLAIGIVAPPLSWVLAGPDGLDLSGEALPVTVIILLVGAAPFGAGFYLVRMAFRAGAAEASEAPGEAPAEAPSVSVAALPSDAPSSSAAPQVPEAPAAAAAAAAAAATAPAPRRKMWLVILGLTITAFGVLYEALLCAFAVSQPHEGPDDLGGLVMLMLLGLCPLALGAWLAHVGEPGIFRRFARELVGHAASLSRPAVVMAMLRHSMGLAFAIAVVCIPMMLIWQQASPMIGVAGLSVYSLADPLQTLVRRSWWSGAILSAGNWIALFVVLVLTAEAIQPMREGGLVFLVPMMLFAAANVISGLAKLAMWATEVPPAIADRPATPPDHV